MTQTPETAPPASLAEVYARLRELAPDPDPSATDPAGTLTRYLAARTWYRWAKDQAQPDELLSADAYAALVSGFTALHAFRALEIARPILAAAVAREIASARADAGDVGEILFTHLTLLGLDPGEITRLAEAAVALERVTPDTDGLESAGADEQTPEALRAALERAERAEAELAKIRELAESWAGRAPAGRSLALEFQTSPRDAVSSDCGRCILGILDREPEPGAEHRDPAWRPE